jgi:tryptophan synthase alpha chain
MSRIQHTFQACAAQHKKALIPFITAGDPHLDHTLAYMHALVAGGADMIELGVPFSDPMADGAVIQRASERALVAGTTLKGILQIVSQFRQQNETTPVILMGYLNPIEAMGYEAFARQAKAAGVDGVLTVDMPIEEAKEYLDQLTAYALAPIFLLAPTSTTERILAVSQYAQGYVYYVSLKGVTGTTLADFSSVKTKLDRIKEHIAVPIVVGFGIRDQESARRVAQIADGVVMGSRLVEMIEAKSADLVSELQTFLNGIRVAIDTA